jgi:hypothetical protein
MFRGTISELVANDHVVIILVSGESKRFASSAVRYAGPASGAPAVSTPSAPPLPSPAPVSPVPGVPTVDYGPFPVQFLATQPGVTFYKVKRNVAEIRGMGMLATGTVVAESFTEICVAPCVATLDRGTYVLSLGIPGQYPVAADTAVRVVAPTTVRGHYESRSDFRLAGWLVAGGSIVAGAVLGYLSIRDCDPGDRDCSVPRVPLLVGGLALGGVGTIVGLLMSGKDDDATVQAQKWEPGR